MKIEHACFLPIFLGTLFFAMPGGALAQCGGAAKCVDINFPGKGKQAVLSQPVMRVSKAQGSFAFGVPSGSSSPGKPIGQAFVIFKCQVETANYADCRTPAEKNGEPAWVVKLAGGTNQLDIASDLGPCEQCLTMQGPADQENCKKNYCTYPYMVVDVGDPSAIPLDPSIIIDQ